jgi:hypothetical protein
MSETKTDKQSKAKSAVEDGSGRKVAPNIVVSSANKKTIDQVITDNQNREFVYTPVDSESSLKAQGLIPVVGEDGRPVRVGNKLICESVDPKRIEEIKRAHQQATESISDVKDPKQVHSADKTAQAKKPAS